MNIGFVSQALPYLPSRGGFRLYGGNLIRCLSRRHRIDLVSLLTDDDAEHLDWPRQYCASVTGIPVSKGRWTSPLNVLSGYLWGKPLRERRKMARALLKRVREWDVIHVEGGFAGGIVPASLPLAKVLSVHDAEVLRSEELLRCSQTLGEKLYYTFRKYYEPRYERLVYPRFERTIVVADRDEKVVQEVAPRAKVALIPYGTDTEYFHPVPVEKQEATLVFHSHLAYAPNIEAALEFADHIFPLVRRQIPKAVFRLVGAKPVKKIQELASRPGIELLADLPDLRSAVCSARIYVCAIQYGTGLKSKVLEAMGMQMPVVCYPGSTVGIACVPGKHLLVAQNAQEFAAYVVDLLRNPKRAEQIAQEGRKLAEEKYSWESRARAFEELYRVVIAERRSRAIRNGRH